MIQMHLQIGLISSKIQLENRHTFHPRNSLKYRTMKTEKLQNLMEMNQTTFDQIQLKILLTGKKLALHGQRSLEKLQMRKTLSISILEKEE